MVSCPSNYQLRLCFQTFVSHGFCDAAADRTAEMGVWKQIGENRYQFRFRTYHAPGGGVPIFYDVVTHEIDLDADNLNYVSAGRAARCSMAGAQIFSECSTAVGPQMTFD